MVFGTDNHQKGTSFKSERLALPHDTNVGNTGLYASPDVVMNIREILLDGKAELVSFIARICKVEGGFGIAREIPIATFFRVHTGVGPSLILKLIVPSTCRISIRGFYVCYS